MSGRAPLLNIRLYYLSGLMSTSLLSAVLPSFFFSLFPLFIVRTGFLFPSFFLFSCVYCNASFSLLFPLLLPLSVSFSPSSSPLTILYGFLFSSSSFPFTVLYPSSPSTQTPTSFLLMFSYLLDSFYSFPHSPLVCFHLPFPPLPPKLLTFSSLLSDIRPSLLPSHPSFIVTFLHAFLPHWRSFFPSSPGPSALFLFIPIPLSPRNSRQA